MAAAVSVWLFVASSWILQMKIDPEYVTLTELLRGRLFRIPNYRRSYSWETANRQALFDDIEKGFSPQGQSSHFIATVVGVVKEERFIDIEKYQFVDVSGWTAENYDAYTNSEGDVQVVSG